MISSFNAVYAEKHYETS